jgi:23S rRNA U2552 (ribose-2'-O)-methylase RlmE/FtsJ
VSEGGWLRLSLKNVGGEGQITAVDLVRFPEPCGFQSRAVSRADPLV